MLPSRFKGGWHFLHAKYPRHFFGWSRFSVSMLGCWDGCARFHLAATRACSLAITQPTQRLTGYSTRSRGTRTRLRLVLVLYSPSPRRHQCLFGAMYRCILDRRKHANVAREVRTIRFEYEYSYLRPGTVPTYAIRRPSVSLRTRPKWACTVHYCTVLYCTVLYCTVLYCTVRPRNRPDTYGDPALGHVRDLNGPVLYLLVEVDWHYGTVLLVLYGTVVVLKGIR